MAIDLVGSTAFKAVKENQSYDKVRPKWVTQFEEFYRTLPREVETQYQDKRNQNQKRHPENGFPRLWKTIGDEIILCSRVVSRSHVSVCVEAFLCALEEYSKRLRNGGHNLDVKGNMWLATFPAQNTGIPLIREPVDDSDVNVSEQIEKDIDEKPHLYDFLGKAIDTGFRIAKHSSAAKCSLSVQLAHLLICEYIHPPENGRSIFFEGTDVFKGVTDGVPYPCLSISTETREAQSELIALEKKVSGIATISRQDLKSYLEKFMEVAAVEKVWLPNSSDETLMESEKPESYKNFERVFKSELTLMDKQDKRFEKDETQPESDQDTEDLPEDHSEELLRNDSGEV